MQRAARRDGEALGARGRPALPLPARDRALGRAPVGRGAALQGAGARPALPVGSHAACARGDADRPRRRPALAVQRPPRPRVASLQDAARLLRADRGAGQGHARDPADRRQGRLGGALPRGGPHRALRAHERASLPDGGAAARRHGRHRGLGDADGASRHRARVAEPEARRAAPGRPCARRRRLAALLRAPLRREADLRDRVLPGGRTSRRCARATPRSSATR